MKLAFKCLHVFSMGKCFVNEIVRYFQLVIYFFQKTFPIFKKTISQKLDAMIKFVYYSAPLL